MVMSNQSEILFVVIGLAPVEGKGSATTASVIAITAARTAVVVVFVLKIQNNKLKWAENIVTDIVWFSGQYLIEMY